MITSDYKRQGKTEALVSTNHQKFLQRKKELESLKRLNALEEDMRNMNKKLDLILSALKVE